MRQEMLDFYSRPCGRGDESERRITVYNARFLLTPLREGRLEFFPPAWQCHPISTHAPAGGATRVRSRKRFPPLYFYSRPCGRGDGDERLKNDQRNIYFYSRPCGRGDARRPLRTGTSDTFLLTPLREGRQRCKRDDVGGAVDFYSRPCGRGDALIIACAAGADLFLLTPLREGRPPAAGIYAERDTDFYSRPCGRGDAACNERQFLCAAISTHAPAGGATAIFHKSVMRFCGKLPKDDTVLCLASFGFPRRDPKAVYLA